MEIDRNVERDDPLPKRREPILVEIRSVRVAVDHRAGETELAYATFQLVGGGRRFLEREVREAAETRRVPSNPLGEKVVRLTSESRSFRSAVLIWTPGVVCDSTVKSIPSASIAAIRPSSTSLMMLWILRVSSTGKCEKIAAS